MEPLKWKEQENQCWQNNKDGESKDGNRPVKDVFTFE